MKYFLPLLFLAYWGGVTLFTHSHVVNGVIIVHSHPFKTGHQHTESQAETIFFLDHYVASSVPVLLVAVPCFCALLGLLVVARTSCLCLRRPDDGIRLRAPPVRCVIVYHRLRRFTQIFIIWIVRWNNLCQSVSFVMNIRSCASAFFLI